MFLCTVVQLACSLHMHMSQSFAVDRKVPRAGEMLGIWVQLSVDKAVEGSALSICVCLGASLPIRVTLPYMGCACVWIVLFHVGVGIPL